MQHDPARVGVRDLDPFGQGGGMIFDPFSGRPPTGRLPSGLGVPGRLPPYVAYIAYNGTFFNRKNQSSI